MNRRTFLSYAAACGGALLAPSALAATPSKPNIVFILIDDLGWMDFGCYGNKVIDTPNIDRIAASGMRFTDAYSNCPVCSPSRAAILTGQYPARLRFTGHITASGQHRHPENSRILPPNDRLFVRLEEITLAEALRPAGYTSAHIGKWHVGGPGYWPENQGFDVSIGGWTEGSPPSYWYPYEQPGARWNASIPTLKGGKPGEYLTDRLTDESISFMDTRRNRPFLLDLWHYAVHTPLQAPEDLVAKYRERMKNSERTIDPVYAAMVERVDSDVGRVLAALERLGIADNTAVIVTSDNGGLSSATDNRPLRKGKGFLYEGGIRVPLIVKWPGHVAPGTLCSEPVMGADLFPTILAMAGNGVEKVNEVDGVDIAPLWRGEEHLGPRALYWYYPHYAPQGNEPGAAVRAGKYKLIESYDPPHIELYDIEKDLGETTNLASAMPDKAKELSNQLRKWLVNVHAQMHTMNAE